jgi:mannose-1-phosphate guanylyltransferase
MSMTAVIMAGGWGERLWPLSRKDLPKQFLPLLGRSSPLQETARKVSLLTSPDNVYVITGSAYLGHVRAQLPWVPAANVVCEPVGRGTAPSIALAAAALRDRSPETVMAVLPADHLVIGDEEFRDTLEKAAATARTTGGLVTIGVMPTRPETGYGYIEVGDQGVPGLEGVRKVERFTEKPHLRRATKYVASGKHLWNSGIFVWTLRAIREAIATHLPELSKGLRPVEQAARGCEFEQAVAECFPSLPNISIDYGVMERAHNAWVVPASFKRWDDLGSWAAMGRTISTDQNGNCLTGKASVLNTRRTVVYSSGGRLVTVLDAQDLLIVDTADVVLVGGKAATSHLKELLSHLQEEGLGEYLGTSGPSATSALWDSVAACHKTVDKPWGREIWWALTDSYAGKILQVMAGHSLSLQYHERKRETMLFLEGEGYLEVDRERVNIRPPMAVDIKPGMVHRVSASRDITLLEVSTPDVEDVVRLEDKYGRSTEIPG